MYDFVDMKAILRPKQMPPLVMYENNQTTGLLPELFSGSVEVLGDGFLVNPVPDWLVKTALNATAFEAGSMDCIRVSTK